MSEMYPLTFFNDTDEEIPPYAVMQMRSDLDGSYTASDFPSRLKFRKYDEFVAQEVHESAISHVPVSRGRILALNSEIPVASGSYGRCSFAYDYPAWARITEESGNGVLNLSGYPAGLTNTEFGPSVDRWDINTGGWGFFFRSPPDLGKKRVLVQQVHPSVPFKVWVLERTYPTTDPATTPLIAIPYRTQGSDLVKCELADGVFTHINITKSPTGFLDWGSLKAEVKWRGSDYEEGVNPTIFETVSGGLLHADYVYYSGSTNGTIGTNTYTPEAVTKCSVELPAGTLVYADYCPENGWLITDFCCPEST